MSDVLYIFLSVFYHLADTVTFQLYNNHERQVLLRTCTRRKICLKICLRDLQVFSYTANKEIRTDDLCLDVSKLNGPVMMLKCHHLKGNQLWEYDPVVSAAVCSGHDVDVRKRFLLGKCTHLQVLLHFSNIQKRFGSSYTKLYCYTRKVWDFLYFKFV